MKLTIVSTYSYLSVTLSYASYPVDDNGCTFAQFNGVYGGFSSLGREPMKSILL